MTLIDILLLPINKIKKLIGTTTDTGGSSTSGTVMGKGNAIIDKVDVLNASINTKAPANTALSTSIWTSTRASYIDYLANGTYGLSAIKSAITSLSTSSGGGCQTFTSNGTFVVPSNVKKIWVTACAGGQGGVYTGSDKLGGQGGDWVFKQPFSVSPNQSISITVGLGGVGGTSLPQKNGSNTVIGSLVTLLGGGVSGNTTGGSGGAYLASSPTASRQGTSGFSGNGGSPSDASSLIGDGGGSLGRGGNGYYPAGSGGGGGCADSSRIGNGGNGVVIIEW